MSEIFRFGLVLVVLVGLGTGCGRKCEAPKAEPTAPEASDVAVPVPATDVAAIPETEAPATAADSVEAESEPEPIAKHPMVSQETWDMPAGIERSRHVRLEVLDQQLDALQRELKSASMKLMEAEKKARVDDPELGRLYSEMVEASMAYRRAIDGCAAYADAKKHNEELRDVYRRQARERDDLKKEIGQ